MGIIRKHLCTRCRKPLSLCQLQREGETLKGWICREVWINPMGLPEECAFFILIFDGGRKEIRRERK